MLVRIANRDDTDQTASEDQMKKQSDRGLHGLSRPFWQTTGFRNSRT